jgi:hypothetical protein
LEGERDGEVEDEREEEGIVAVKHVTAGVFKALNHNRDEETGNHIVVAKPGGA